MDHGRSIRVVGRPHTFGRKMSGLGIDFSEASTPDSPAYHWEADLPNHPSFVYEGTVPRSSRWSESTQQSRATRAASHSDDSSRLSQGTSIASRQSSQPVTDAQYTSSICITKRPSLVEVQAFRNGNLDQRSARGSDDSQNSVGPITPCDEIDDNHIKVGGLYSFGEAPRKAPLPPVSTVEVPKDMTSKLARRPSLTQSMLRTLSGRKKETRPPPPLVLAQPIPPIPAIPAKYEVAPIVHHLDRPVTKRAEVKATACTTTLRKSPALINASPRPTSSSGRRGSGASFGNLFRSVKNSISRRQSKASPLIEASGKMSVLTTPVLSVKSNAPSFVNVQVETFMEVRSTPSSPCPDQEAAHKAIHPVIQAVGHTPRPSTAPASKRPEFSLRTHRPSFNQSKSSSIAPLSITIRETNQSDLDIQYRDPWKTSYAFVPSSEYSQHAVIPPSPPSWLVTHQQACSKAEKKQKEESNRIKNHLAVPIKTGGSSYATSTGGSSYSMGSASPTSVPSWTPMVALPSPDVSVISTPAKNFLDLEASPSVVSDFVHTPGSSKKSTHQCPAGGSQTYLLTPGRISMRDPWATREDAESTRSRIAAGGIQLSRDASDASRYSDSPAASTKSPYCSSSPRARRPSRKAVPKMDEDVVKQTSASMSDDKSNKIYTGCRPFHRPSVDEQLSGIPQFKNPFITRSSLSNVKEGYVDDSVHHIPRTLSLAGRGASSFSIATTTTTTSDQTIKGPRPSFPTFETSYSFRRPSYASDVSNQSFPSKPTRFEFRRPTLTPANGIRISFDSNISH